MVSEDSGFIEIKQAWTRVPPGNSKTTGGYLTIYNHGTKPDVLIGGFTKVANKLELHEMKLTDGIMKMRPLNSGIPIPPNSNIELKPGGKHLMLTNLSEQLEKGNGIQVTLIFEIAGDIEVVFDVADIGAKEAPITPTHGN